MENQKLKVLNYIKDNGSITPQEAYNRFGIMRLGARIYDLKQDGYNIHSETVYKRLHSGKTVHYAKYSMIVQ